MKSVEADIMAAKDVCPELLHEAHRFIKESRWTMPRILTGHPVSHEDVEAKIKNFSTITRLVTTSDGGRYFLIYRYPLSFIHSLTDNIQRWVSGRPSSKPFRRSTWHRRFGSKSRIPLIDLSIVKLPAINAIAVQDLPGLVVMEYIPNYNLWEMLQSGQAYFGCRDVNVKQALNNVVEQINEMHRADETWGELIVHNIILRTDNHMPVICDTEVEYWPWVSLLTKKAHDWRDFIFSACGAYNASPDTKKMLARVLFVCIEDRDTQRELVNMCRKRRHLGQIIFWQGMGGALSCSWSNYTLIRKAIVKAWEEM